MQDTHKESPVATAELRSDTVRAKGDCEPAHAAECLSAHDYGEGDPRTGSALEFVHSDV